MSAPTPPPMTQEESNSEIFLGPTGSETEEFYSYQRKNPGLEKGQYLEWFQKRFHKEIELRRRRSDQPSDLEFMVIKKRSKYRERIGEESVELVAYSDANPHKTYRQLAEWFQKRFAKEIDITAISRMLKKAREMDERELIVPGAIKRSRELDIGLNGEPHPDHTPPLAKRGRRSVGSVPTSLQSINSMNGPNMMGPNVLASQPLHQQPQHVGTSSFAVDLTRNHHSNAPTPINLTPNHTPKGTNAHLSTPEGRRDNSPKNHLRELPPPPPHPQMHPPTNGVPHSPRRPMWASVNANGNAPFHADHDRRRSRSPPRHEPPPPPPSGHGHSQQLPSARELGVGSGFPSAHPPPLPSHSLASTPLAPSRPNYSHPAVPNHHPTRLPPVSAAPPLLNAMPPVQPTRRSPVNKDAFAVLQNMLNSQDEARLATKELLEMQHDRVAFERSAEAKIAQLHADNSDLAGKIEKLNAWNADLQRGNIELQQYQPYKGRFERAVEDVKKLQNDNHWLAKENRHLNDEIKQRDHELRVQTEAIKDLDIKNALVDRKARMQMEEWVEGYVSLDRHHMSMTEALISDIDKAGVRDIEAKISALRDHIQMAKAKKEEFRTDWEAIVRSFISPKREEEEREGTEASNDHKNSALNLRRRPDSRQESATVSERSDRRGSPSTASTSPLHAGSEDVVMKDKE